MIAEFGQRSFVTWKAEDLRKEREAEKEIQMREIKFRAWHKEKNEYIHESKIVDSEKCPVIPDGITFALDDKGQVIFEQFTGLKDKNGKEIYEGDIVMSLSSQRAGGKAKYTVIFEQGGFSFISANGNCNRNNWPADFVTPKNWEIIGTIHQNPELMEQENG